MDRVLRELQPCLGQLGRGSQSSLSLVLQLSKGPQGFILAASRCHGVFPVATTTTSTTTCRRTWATFWQLPGPTPHHLPGHHPFTVQSSTPATVALGLDASAGSDEAGAALGVVGEVMPFRVLFHEERLLAAARCRLALSFVTGQLAIVRRALAEKGKLQRLAVEALEHADGAASVVEPDEVESEDCVEVPSDEEGFAELDGPAPELFEDI